MVLLETQVIARAIPKGKTSCHSCGAEITINNFKKRIVCPACGKKYEVTMEDKEWTWIWGATGNIQLKAKIREIQSRPSRSASKQLPKYSTIQQKQDHARAAKT